MALFDDPVFLLGMNLLANNQWSSTPQSLAGNVGQAMQQTMQQAMLNEQLAQRREYQKAEMQKQQLLMKKMQIDMDAEMKSQEAIDKYLSGLKGGQASALTAMPGSPGLGGTTITGAQPMASGLGGIDPNLLEAVKSDPVARRQLLGALFSASMPSTAASQQPEMIRTIEALKNQFNVELTPAEIKDRYLQGAHADRTPTVTDRIMTLANKIAAGQATDAERKEYDLLRPPKIPGFGAYQETVVPGAAPPADSGFSILHPSTWFGGTPAPTTAPSTPDLPAGVTEQDVQDAMKKFGKSRDEVIAAYRRAAARQ